MLPLVKVWKNMENKSNRITGMNVLYCTYTYIVSFSIYSNSKLDRQIGIAHGKPTST